MGAIATFNFQGWVTRYPEFANVSKDQASTFFSEATLWFRNDGSGPVADPANQLMYLGMLTAHIAALSVNKDGTPKDSNSPVGRINSASEGSVSMGTENQYPPGSPQWYQQTRYGSAFYSATAQYRRFKYRGRRTPLGPL